MQYFNNRYSKLHKGIILFNEALSGLNKYLEFNAEAFNHRTCLPGGSAKRYRVPGSKAQREIQ